MRLDQRKTSAFQKGFSIISHFHISLCHSREGGNPGFGNSYIKLILDSDHTVARTGRLGGRNDKKANYMTSINYGRFLRNPR